MRSLPDLKMLWTKKITDCIYTQWLCYFILPGFTGANLCMYLVILFYQLVKNGQFFTQLVKKNG